MRVIMVAMAARGGAGFCDHDEHDGHGDGHDKEVCLSQTSLPKNMPKRRHD